jgi:hypothetical protein
MNFLVLHLPYLLCLAVLVIVLLLREHQNAKIQKGLIDRLLIKQGLEPLPEIEPLAEITGTAKREEIADKIEQTVKAIARLKRRPEAVRFQIPGMEGMPRAGMGETKAK